MDEDTSALDTKFESLASRLSSIERRLDRLETQPPAVAARPAPGPDETIRAADSPGGLGMPDVGSVVALIGRTIFVLAGAFLLRALTDSGRLDAGLGVLLGLAYAATWVVMADRAAGRVQSASAAFHGVAFVLIAFPLLFEATTRFHFLSPVSAAVGLSGCTAMALAVSWRHHLQSLAWVASFAGVMTAIVMMLGTAEVGPFALFLVLLGVAVLWLGYLLEWTLLRWPVALIADLAILILSVRAVTPGAADAPGMALGVQIVLLIAYLGSFATRTLVRNRDVIPFEVAQSIAAVIVGLGGAAVLTDLVPTRSGELPIGVATLALAVSCYSAAAIFVERRQSRRRNYYFYTSAGLVFVLVGSALAMPFAAVAWVYGLVGLMAAWAGQVARRGTYRAHGAAYLLAAVVASGLLPYVLYGVGLPLVPGRRATATMFGVLVLCGVAWWGLGPEGVPTAVPPARRAPRLIVLVLLLGGLLGTTVSWGFGASDGSYAAAPGLVATVRTALLVASILTLAMADRLWAFTEGAWLVYPLLVLTGMKFVIEDIRAGRPSTLFVSFALYGLALIFGPRLCRRQGRVDDVLRGRPPS